MKKSDRGARIRGSEPLQRPALEMMVVDGELVYRRLRYRRDYVTETAQAIRLLRAGHVIWALQYGPLITAIQRGMAA